MVGWRIICAAMKQRILLQIIADQLAALKTLATEVEFLKSVVADIPVMSQHYSQAAKRQPFSPTLDEIQALRQRVQFRNKLTPFALNHLSFIR